MYLKDFSFWTSGTNAGVGCDDTWGWCSTKTLFQNPFKMWMSGAPFAPRTKRCAQMNMNADPTKVVFEDYPCGSTRYFVCEVNFTIITDHFNKNAHINREKCQRAPNLNALPTPVRLPQQKSTFQLNGKV